MKTKILIVISNMEFGGAQRQIVELVNNTDQNRFEIHVCSLSEYAPLAEQFKEHIQSHIIHKKAKFDFSVVFKLACLIRKHNFQIIHSFLFDAEIASRLAAKLSGTNIKVIGSERNANYILKPIKKWSYLLTKNLVSDIIANSRSGADFNAQQTGQNKNKYHVVYNGVDTSRFKLQNKQATRLKLKIDKNCQLIGMFASFKEQKNHPFLIETLNSIRQQGQHFKLLLVGDVLHGGMHGSDTYSTMIKQKIEDSLFSNDVIYLGNREDIENVYPACDFTVLPSLFEGTPNVLLESMACGVPVIATDVSDNSKIITQNDSGFIVEVNNIKQFKESILLLLNDKDRLKVISKKARNVMIEKFSTKQLAENMTQIYKEVSQR